MVLDWESKGYGDQQEKERKIRETKESEEKLLQKSLHIIELFSSEENIEMFIGGAILHNKVSRLYFPNGKKRFIDLGVDNISTMVDKKFEEDLINQWNNISGTFGSTFADIHIPSLFFKPQDVSEEGYMRQYVEGIVSEAKDIVESKISPEKINLPEEFIFCGKKIDLPQSVVNSLSEKSKQRLLGILGGTIDYTSVKDMLMDVMKSPTKVLDYGYNPNDVRSFDEILSTDRYFRDR